MQSFAPGQVWSYKTRPGEEASRITVCRVESHPRLGQIVHIHVKRLRLLVPQTTDNYSDEISHMPYSADALRNSVWKLESTEAALPDFEEGYQEWREAFDRGGAGVWTVAVSEAIAVTESAANA